jgi:alpha-N-acetylglucosaminidase
MKFLIGKFYWCITLLFMFSSLQTAFAQSNDSAVKAAYGLINRTIPGYADNFIVEITPNMRDKDFFELESRGKQIVLRGNNGVSIASALNHYLKYYAHCDISWNGTNLNLPDPLPAVPEKIRKESPYKYRYYFNYCTFNYTASWWDWERWQKEIDFMALSGINMPLALTGQNAVWKRVYKSMGFTDQELDKFFSGPAYFSWFWMGNLDGYGGPLPDSWMKSHEELQKKMLEAERGLGMKPVLPAFSGHVPPSFRERFPDTKLIGTVWDDCGFDTVYSVSPSDTMFVYIGGKFMAEQTKTFGTDHYYSSDTFNENRPPSNDSLFLKGVSEKVYSSMTKVDPEAVWVMMGWLFFFDRTFWHNEQIEALLSGVPNDKMIILDLFTENYPVWDKSEAYFGKNWIWCLLHNFGGNVKMHGEVAKIANEPLKTLRDKTSGNMIGIGITAEAIEQNPAVYEIMLENAWRDEIIDPVEWVKEYSFRRYGKKNDNAMKGWETLLNTVYNNKDKGSGRESVINLRPRINIGIADSTGKMKVSYDPAEFLEAFNSFIAASDELKASDGFQYDVVNIARQALANYSNMLYIKFNEAYKNKDIAAFKKYSSRFLEVFDDMDRLVGTRKDFLLGPWINSAKSWGVNESETKLYEKNARNILTTWGDKNSPLYDYAHKQWSGLLKDFYKPRWEMFISYILKNMESGTEPDMEYITNEIKEQEWRWVEDTKSYPNEPAGNPVAIAKEIHEKYSAEMKNIIPAK